MGFSYLHIKFIKIRKRIETKVYTTEKNGSVISVSRKYEEGEHE